MTVIRIDTGQIQDAGASFERQSGEVQQLIGQAQTLMNSLEGQFTGQRAQRIFSEWQEMQPRLRTAHESLLQASNLMKRAAQDFTQVDSGG